MNRRDFLQRIGLGSLVAGSSVPLLGSPALAHLESEEENERHFRFVAFGLAGGTEAIVMEGSGVFGSGVVQANGSFLHFTWPPPSTLLGHGTWKRKRGGDFNFEKGFGSVEVIEASILTLEIRMIPGEGTGADPFTATLQVNCNVEPFGISTGLAEGIVLTLPDGTTFEPAGGLTFISTKH